MTTFKPPDTSPGPVAYESGSIWWKGSSGGWLWLHRNQAERLRAEFAASTAAGLQAYAKALAGVIALYDADNRNEEAA